MERNKLHWLFENVDAVEVRSVLECAEESYLRCVSSEKTSWEDALLRAQIIQPLYYYMLDRIETEEIDRKDFLKDLKYYK
jgi:hypothetical protein